MDNFTQAPRPLGIKELCAKWKASTRSDDGRVTIGGPSDQYRLLVNGVRFHDLSHEELREAAVGLIQVLLVPGLTSVVDDDHIFFWSWSAELIVGMRPSTMDMDLDYETSQLAALAFRAALANCGPAKVRGSGVDSESIEHNAQHLVQEARRVLPYLAFPLLEAVTKRACSAYVDLRGKVVADFSGRYKQYRAGKQCSNVSDLLYLLVRVVASPQLRRDLEEVLQHIEDLARAGGDAESSGYKVVYDWRNSSLHGETSLPVIGGTVLSLAVLIILDGIRETYPTRRDNALRTAYWEMQTGRQSRHSWSYYPPYIS